MIFYIQWFSRFSHAIHPMQKINSSPNELNGFYRNTWCFIENYYVRQRISGELIPIRFGWKLNLQDKEKNGAFYTHTHFSECELVQLYVCVWSITLSPPPKHNFLRGSTSLVPAPVLPGASVSLTNIHPPWLVGAGIRKSVASILGRVKSTKRMLFMRAVTLKLTVFRCLLRFSALCVCVGV